MNILLIVLFAPLAAFLLTIFLPREGHETIRRFALAASLLVFVISLGLIGPVTASPRTLTQVTDVSWIPSPAIRFHIGVDGLSMWLVILTTLLTPICVLISWKNIQKNVKEFFAFLLLLEFGLTGVFVAHDLFLFYVFWEVGLVPMYFLIGIWGHERRIYAALKFFLYTMAGSVLMLGAIIYLYNLSGTFDLVILTSQISSGHLVLSAQEQLYLFLAFFVAFAIKVPLFPLHTWLPDAHGEAPTAGSVMLASVMLKLGCYGLIRICLPMFPSAARECSSWIITLAIIGIIYGALVAMVQPNIKRLVAYSSVSHLGFVVLGIFCFNQTALDGAVYQMLNHGISTGALFIMVGFLYERRHSLEIADYGGVATVAPKLSAVFMVTMLASIGLPTLNNFVGEFMVLVGASEVSIKLAIFAGIGVVLSACYMLWMYQRTFFGTTPDEVKHHLFDMRGREWAAMLPLMVLMVWMGIWTRSFLPPLSEANTRILDISLKNVEFRVSNPADTSPLARLKEVIDVR